MQPIDINAQREAFKALAHQHIKRQGLERLLTWLEQETDFFTAPSSTRFHLNTTGGLCLHSMNVFDTALRLWHNVIEPHGLATDDDRSGKPNPAATTKAQFRNITEEKIAVATLFHDLCKCNLYVQEEKWKKDENNRWMSYPGYGITDNLPLGHGEKSCMLITRFMGLYDDEYLAVRWHMGMFDIGENGSTSRMSFYRAMELSPLVTLVHASDYLTSQCFEPTIIY